MCQYYQTEDNWLYMLGKSAAAAGMGWLCNFITLGLNKSVTFSTYELKKKVFKRDGQSCVIVPYLDCLDCVNWGCKVLERRGSQKRDSWKEEGVLGKIQGGKREGEVKAEREGITGSGRWRLRLKNKAGK